MSPAASAGSLARRLELIVVADVEFADDADLDLVAIVRAALRGGAPAVQLRSKRGTTRTDLDLAHRLRRETRAAGALFFVNDHLDVALASGADGAHLGDDDLPLPDARRLAPAPFLLGRSVADADAAWRAEAEGADYVGIGPVYATGSKADAGEPVGISRVRPVCDAVRIPVVGIGGIDAGNSAAVRAAGAAGVAVIRAVLGAADPARAARDLLSAGEAQ